jgi:hypothetical protein
MALKLRMTDVKPHDYGTADAQYNVQIEAYDTVTGRVVDRGNLAYSGDALSKLTTGQIASRIQADALAWAADRKAQFSTDPNYAKNIATMAKVSSLIGAEVAIP